MEDNTKKIMLVSTILGSVAALTFGYKYYYEPSEIVETNKNNDNNDHTKQFDEEKSSGSFLSSLTQTIGFGGLLNKNPDENTTKKEVSFELEEKKHKNEDSPWPTFVN